MKTKFLAFFRSYHAALRSQLMHPSRDADVRAARKLGLRALELGLSTHDVARIHEEALLRLVPPDTSARTRNAFIRGGVAFFGEASETIEESRHGARTATARLKSIIGTLTLRTSELAVSNKKLKSEILQRKSVEKSLRTSEQTTSHLLKGSHRMQEELRLLSRRLLSVQEDERKRISRELHDVVAQALTGINVRLAMLKTETTASTADLHKKIATTQRLVQKSVEIVHRFARDLRPTVLDDLGLIPALQSYLKVVREETGLQAGLTAFAGVEKLDGGAKTALYRIVQESLANVVRHAKASRVSVRIADQKGKVCMEIQDDGRGFQMEEIAVAESGMHLGLLGMRERVEMVGGTFCVESAPGKSTTIRVEVPYRQVRKRPLKQPQIPALECP
ncbi:MAG: sensor histidine kinase [Verrucomicrobia bacterium]|nr:sensor histidine kinase [Verrucomicrobiota bacterium]